MKTPWKRSKKCWLPAEFFLRVVKTLEYLHTYMPPYMLLISITRIMISVFDGVENTIEKKEMLAISISRFATMFSIVD